MALPLRMQGFNQTVHLPGLQLTFCVQGQAAGDRLQGLQVQAVAIQLAFGQSGALAIGVFQGQVAAGPMQTIRGFELHILGRDLKAFGVLPAGHAAL